MARATRIRMNDSKGFSNDVTEIKDIYLTGVKKPAYYSKESIYDFLNCQIKLDRSSILT